MIGNAAVKFRGRVFESELHVDALKDCIECPDWPESHEEIEALMDAGGVEFGRIGAKGYHPFPAEDDLVRRQWYLNPY